MKNTHRGLAAIGLGLSAFLSSGAQAYNWPTFEDIKPSHAPAGIQCVPYARGVSGIRIFGDAWTWWEQAEGRYVRGNKPRIGAVMVLKPHGQMQLGHVAVVSQIIDKRTVLLRHANWSPINGVRGQIEENVHAVDVSPDNDWSAVRVWFAPLQNLGTTHWPVQGFIYKTPSPARVLSPAEQFAVDPIGAIITRAQMAAAKRSAAPAWGPSAPRKIMALSDDNPSRNASAKRSRWIKRP